MKKIDKLTIASLMLTLCLLAPVGAAVAADDTSSSTQGKAALQQLTNAGKAAKYDTTAKDPSVIIGNIIYQILTVVGIILVCLVIYAGFLWATAGGNADQITKARKILVNAVIGLVIVFAAYTITYFVIERITEATISTSGTST
jgi:hypothetical protein